MFVCISQTTFPKMLLHIFVFNSHFSVKVSHYDISVVFGCLLENIGECDVNIGLSWCPCRHLLMLSTTAVSLKCCVRSQAVVIL